MDQRAALHTQATNASLSIRQLVYPNLVLLMFLCHILALQTMKRLIEMHLDTQVATETLMSI